MIRNWVLALLLIGSSVEGQIQFKINHRLGSVDVPFFSNSILPNSVDTVRILAVMVEFQTDNTDETTGDGTFIMTGSREQVDPPPHDSVYFRNKIRFVENYFRKVSDGRLTVKGELLGQRVVLAKTMSSYSPPTTMADNRKLAELAQESWIAAESSYSGINFADYDLFVVFHAGVGRDIDLLSSLGYNPAPFDIPSLYLDSTALAAALNQSAFNGLVNGNVKNTIILPETESREIDGVKLNLSINGLFAASIGSYLRLPDLFDTKTGRSGIGQFGLMDGAGFFAYNGLFPPEPNAWEKVFLGWVTPITAGNSVQNLSVPAVGLNDAAEDTIYRIPINNSEYFLVENRIRNPYGAGIYLTFAGLNGDSIVHFEKDIKGFKYYDIDTIKGSVVDVSSYDWALIGEMSDTTDKYDGGGILIWHIDENVIKEGLKSNTVNADIEHRGVELKEADGSKDIGQKYEDLSYESGTEYGSPLDCWFSGNPAFLYKNSFDLNSFPNSNSHSGAASLIAINNFSQRSERMSIDVEIGNSVLVKDSALCRTLSNTNLYPTSTRNHIYIPAENGIYAFKNDGNGLSPGFSPLISAVKSDFGVAVCKLSGNTEMAVSANDDTLRIFNISTAGDPVVLTTAVVENKITASPCIVNFDSLYILVGAEKGFYKYSADGRLISGRSAGTGEVSSIAVLPGSSSESSYFTSGNYIYSEQDSAELPNSAYGWMLAAAVSPKGNFIAAFEKNGTRVVSFDGFLQNKNFDIVLDGDEIQETAVADIDGDGEKDIIIQSKLRVVVLNRMGLMLDGFPITVKAGLEFSGTPLVADFDGDARPEILLMTNNGAMWIHEGDGKLQTGFPIQAAGGKAQPVLYESPYPQNKLGIAVITEDGELNAFLTGTSTAGRVFYWYQHLGSEQHLNADTSIMVARPISSEFFPKSRVYNWPNPVYGSLTHIRYYTSENSDITITIIDLSGVKITELKGKGTAGMDNEIIWHVSNIQSGIYLARVEAKGAAQSSTALIKIAVVK
ncbi:MAG: T9SS type A sorting domain-containing protein [Bacteroidetes bacterium]|nr:T9SS type A sorting domain-containing protein [Bacteroidota bacterium]